LALLANGASNKEIARRLELSEATVKLHVHRILRVLGGKNRTEAAHLARTLGLLDR
jgi:DNA-binding NarL/FixJ family response regulator